MSDLDRRYPIGRLELREMLEPAARAEAFDRIKQLPGDVRSAVADLGPEDWELRYRSGGWTIRQVVHHLADSHLQALIRVKLALTEDTPILRPYREMAWAELPDVTLSPPELSLSILDGLHGRFAILLDALPEEAFRRGVHHPENDRIRTIDDLVQTYAWHGAHHLAHIGLARGITPSPPDVRAP